jgi:transposase
MKSFKSIEISSSLNSAKAILANDKSLSETTRAVFSLLVTIAEILISKFGANSKNSSVPPSQDPSSEEKKRTATGKKPGGQLGRAGKTLSQVEKPDEIVEVKIDPKHLPTGTTFKEFPPEKRQVFDIRLTVHVTEYQVQVLKDSQGHAFKAICPTKERLNTAHLCVG